LLSFATNHAPHVHLVKASPRTGAKAGRRFSEKEKKTTGFLRGNGNRSFQRKRRGSGQSQEKKEGPVHGGLQIRPGCARLKKRTKPAVNLNQVGIFPNQGGRDASALQTKRRGEIKKPIGIGTAHHRGGSARRDPGAKKQKTKQQRPK